jgi:hypothetical protein
MQFIWFMMMFSDNMYPWKSQWLILPPTKMTFREFINSSSYGSHAAWHFLTMAHMNGPTCPLPSPHGNAINMFEKWLKEKLADFFSTPVHANYIYIYIPKSIIVPSFSDHSVSKTSKVVFTFLCHYIHHYPFYIQFFSMFLSSVQNLPTISCQRTAQWNAVQPSWRETLSNFFSRRETRFLPWKSGFTREYFGKPGKL